MRRSRKATRFDGAQSRTIGRYLGMTDETADIVMRMMPRLEMVAALLPLIEQHSEALREIDDACENIDNFEAAVRDNKAKRAAAWDRREKIEKAIAATIAQHNRNARDGQHSIADAIEEIPRGRMVTNAGDQADAYAEVEAFIAEDFKARMTRPEPIADEPDTVLLPQAPAAEVPDRCIPDPEPEPEPETLSEELTAWRSQMIAQQREQEPEPEDEPDDQVVSPPALVPLVRAFADAVATFNAPGPFSRKDEDAWTTAYEAIARWADANPADSGRASTNLESVARRFVASHRVMLGDDSPRIYREYCDIREQLFLSLAMIDGAEDGPAVAVPPPARPEWEPDADQLHAAAFDQAAGTIPEPDPLPTAERVDATPEPPADYRPGLARLIREFTVRHRNKNPDIWTREQSKAYEASQRALRQWAEENPPSDGETLPVQLVREYALRWKALDDTWAAANARRPWKQGDVLVPAKTMDDFGAAQDAIAAFGDTLLSPSPAVAPPARPEPRPDVAPDAPEPDTMQGLGSKALAERLSRLGGRLIVLPHGMDYQPADTVKPPLFSGPNEAGNRPERDSA